MVDHMAGATLAVNADGVPPSDYWQGQLNIKEVIQLSELMLHDIRRVCLGLVELQQDVDLSPELATYQPTDSGLEAYANSVQQTNIALLLNVQDKFAYDKLMQECASL